MITLILLTSDKFFVTRGFHILVILAFASYALALARCLGIEFFVRHVPYLFGQIGGGFLMVELLVILTTVVLVLLTDD